MNKIMISLTFCNIKLYFYCLVFLFSTCAQSESVVIVELKSSWTLTNKNQTISKSNLSVPTGVYSALYGEEVLQSYNDVNMRWIAYDNWTYTKHFSAISKSNLSVPTGVYSALYGEEVLQSYNDVNMRWIAYDNWTYTKHFSVDLNLMKILNFINLTFYGIDTVADIRLNHHFVGHTDNMFVRYSFNVTNYLKEENLLEVFIESPISAAFKSAKNKSVPPECPPKDYNGECHINMLRKMQASFGWDWGLAAPSMGIWKPIVLEYYDVGLIRDIDIATFKNETHWLMDVKVFIDAAGDQDFYAKLNFGSNDFPSISAFFNFTQQKISHLAPMIKFQRVIPINDVELWWPNGYGMQKLYAFNFTLNAWLNESGPRLGSKSISQKTINVGFRTIQLEENDDEDEGTFIFKINDVEMFMKGSNYVPAHILPEFSSNKARIEHLLQSARDTYMNMLRVWGGGVYQSDDFYDLADQYGILIWQDMMFACALYPNTEEFLKSVRTEVRQNALRLSHHACIALFATNNEIEQALQENWYGTDYDRENFISDYQNLFVKTIMDELKIIEHQSRAKVLISSPSSDVHYFAYGINSWSINSYPRPTFASEYGFQSLPHITVWNTTLAPKDDLLDLIKHRQHQPGGHLTLLYDIGRHFRLPSSYDDNFADALIYFSQINQAMSIKTETEFYRSLRDSEHHTMGALYWQLNDVWVAPSWSSIDFYGNYKILHHWVKEFMAPIAIIAFYDAKSGTVNISLACDKLQVNNENLKVVFNIHLWSKLFWNASTTWNVDLKPNGVQYVKQLSIDSIFINGLTAENCFFQFLLKRGPITLSHTYVFPTSFKSIEGLTDPDLKLQISSRICQNKIGFKINIFSLAITVKFPAAFVYIEVIHKHIKKYKLSHNGFMLTVPVEIIKLEFKSDHCIILKPSNIKILTVNHLHKKSSKYNTAKLKDYWSSEN